MSRDHAVRALFALHLAPVEFDHVVASQVIRRKFWPPKTCEGAVVGLCASGLVFGEAQLVKDRGIDARQNFLAGVIDYAMPMLIKVDFGLT